MKLNLFYIILFLSCFSCAKQTVSASEPTESTEQLNVQLTPKSDSVTYPISVMLLIEGGAAKAQGELKKAMEYFEAAITTDSNNDAAHYELATLYLNLFTKSNDNKELDYAIDHMERAVNIDPSNATYKTFYSHLLIDSGQMEKGISMMQELANQFPKNIEYKYDLAFSYEQAKQYDKALAIYNDIEEVYGFNPEINYHKHKIYFAQDKIEEGIAEIEEIIETNPQYATYSAYLTDFFIASNNLEKAKFYNQKLIDTNKDDPKANAAAATIAIRLGNAEDTKMYLQNLINNKELSLDDKVKMMVPFIEEVMKNKAMQKPVLESVNELVKQYPEEAKVHALVGDFASNLNMLDHAFEAYMNAVKYDKTVFSVWEQLLLLTSAKNNYGQLASIADEAAVYHKNEFLPHYLGGFAYSHLEQYQNAANRLELAAPLATNQPYLLVEIYALLGDAYQNLGKYEQSNLNFDKALLEEPDNEYVLNNYSYYLAQRNEQLQKAEKMAKRAMELNPNDSNTKDTYGYVLFKLGEYKKALLYFIQAFEANPNSSVIAEHLGDAYSKLNNTAKALEFWNIAKDLQSDSTTLSQKIIQKQFINE